MNNLTYDARFVSIEAGSKVGLWRRLWLAVLFVCTGEMPLDGANVKLFNARLLP